MVPTFFLEKEPIQSINLDYKLVFFSSILLSSKNEEENFLKDKANDKDFAY